MKKLALFVILSLGLSSSMVLGRDGGGLGVQFGPVAFGLGGSSRGPIFGVGPSPDPNIPFSAVIIPGGCCCDNSCSMRTEDCCGREVVYVDAEEVY